MLFNVWFTVSVNSVKGIIIINVEIIIIVIIIIIIIIVIVIIIIFIINNNSNNNNNNIIITTSSSSLIIIIILAFKLVNPQRHSLIFEVGNGGLIICAKISRDILAFLSPIMEIVCHGIVDGDRAGIVG